MATLTGSSSFDRTLLARAPGRVNLIGDHADYNEGLALPMAIDLATEIELVQDGSDRLLLRSTVDTEPVTVPLGGPFDPGTLATLRPLWARLATAVVGEARPTVGGMARVTTAIPIGAGLSSSAAFGVALATVLGVTSTPVEMARLCQRAEAATGADVGLMDPLVIGGARAGFAMLVDFATLEVGEVPIPDEVSVVVVHSGEERRLGESPYAVRRSECTAAAQQLGKPLGRATEAELAALEDPVLRQRGRHVITECLRVREFSGALRAGDPLAAGRVMIESHRSVAGDFASSTPRIDALIDDLLSRPGVYGARLTGGGFGGCVVALTCPGALDPGDWPGRAWQVSPASGASLRVVG